MDLYKSLLMIALGYFLGALPFGYWITHFSTGKNILEIGWRKNSASNVFRNIGKWQGVATGLLDFLKGFLAVYLAKLFYFPIEVQVISGALAVVGHNWSIFLKFAGGRGIATFAGALLAFSPKILGLSLIPAFIVSLVYDAAVGTFFLLIAGIVLPFYLGQYLVISFFTLFSLAPIFIKRLSPVREIIKSNDKKGLIKNRLIFDDDRPHLQPRIERIVNFFKT